MSKELFLTIDDFPSKAAEEMLYFLQERKINAVIFCIGKELARHENLAVQALSMGFILANHSYTHRAFSGLYLCQAYREIEKTDVLLQKIYEKAGKEWKNKYFRFPYGDKGDGTQGHVFTRSFDVKKRLHKRKIQKRLAELGYTQLVTPGVTYGYYQNFLAKERDTHWTLDVMEWCLKRTNGMFAIKNEADVQARLFAENPFDVRGEVPEEKYGLPFSSSNEVVLMHDCEKTFSSFKASITEMHDRGYRFATFF